MVHRGHGVFDTALIFEGYVLLCLQSWSEFSDILR
jgi:hypothetical protein